MVKAVICNTFMERPNPLSQLRIQQQLDRDAGLVVPLPSDPEAMLPAFCNSLPYQVLIRNLYTYFGQLRESGRALSARALYNQAWGEAWQLMTTLAFANQLPDHDEFQVINNTDSLQQLADGYLFPDAAESISGGHYAELDGVMSSRKTETIHAVLEATLLKNVFKPRPSEYNYAQGKVNWLDIHRLSPLVDDDASCALLVAGDSHIPRDPAIRPQFEVIDFPFTPEKFDEHFVCPTRRRRETERSPLVIVRYPIGRDRFKQAVNETAGMDHLLTLAQDKAEVVEVLDQRATQLRFQQQPRHQTSRFTVSMNGRPIYRKR